jgi:superfamily II DNA/RNA helicase
MPAETISIKPNNHRIYECPNDKKIELLNKLIQENSGADILVMCSENPEAIKENVQNKDVRVLEDKQLVKEKELTCEYLISYDMPIKAIVYMARVSKATKKAVMLLDESEQKALHAIEILLGRAIKQERIEGFQYPKKQVKTSDEPKVKKLSKDKIKEVAKKRYESSTQEKPKRDFRSDEKKDDKWAKKKKAPNKFLGKDENGKAIFSGKSGERNHRHDGTPREKLTGKKINIKASKPKED